MSIKLLFLTPYSFNSYGGVQEQIKLLKESLECDKNYEIKIFAPDTNDFIFNNTFKIPFNGSVSKVSLFPNKNLLKEALDWSDIVHIHEPFIPIIFWNIPKNKKYVFTHHAKLNLFITSLLKILYLLKRIEGKSVHVSESAKGNAQSLNNNSLLIPNMYKLNKKAFFKKKDHFLFIGRDEPRKNFKLYKKLSLVEKFNHIKFSAITNKTKNYKNISVYSNITDQEKLDLLKKTDIYIAVNKKNESFGITLLEAINNGNIAVCTDLPFFINVLGDSGIYFKNNNLSSLINVLTNLKNQNLENIWNKQNSHIKKYEISTNIEKYKEVYKSI